MKKIRYRPGRANSMLGLIAGTIFTGMGLFYVIPKFGAFGIFWTFLAAFVTVVNGLNVFTKRGVTTGTIIVEDDEEHIPDGSFLHSEDLAPRRNSVSFNPSKAEIERKIAESSASRKGRDPEERLTELYRLYNRHLITKEEYNKKRAEILKDI